MPYPPCQLCGEPCWFPNGIHRECALRSAIGGIGHLLDHAHFCHGPLGTDAGLSYRLSALLVDTWVSHHGVDTTVQHSIDTMKEQADADVQPE